MLIAICDDDKEFVDEVLLLCKKCIQDRSKIVTFYDGKELLEYSEDIDLIILDIEMPGINGIEVKNEIKK